MPLRDWTLTRHPPWLLDDYGAAWGRAMGDTKDSAVDRLRERVAARMPVRPGASNLAPYGPAGALDAIGRDRMMPRALGEGDAAYAERLADAWTIHEDGGTPRGALRALRAAGYPEAMLVIRSQRLYRLDAAGDLVVQTLPAGSWCYEPEPQPFWSRYSILFSIPNLPPSWPVRPTDYKPGPVEPSDENALAPPPELAVLADPPTSLRVRVEILFVYSAGQADLVTFRYRFNPSEEFRVVEDAAVGIGTNPLYAADDSGPFLSLTFPAAADGTNGGDSYLAGSAFEWPVEPTSQDAAVPAQDSVQMNLIRQLTKEWSNAAAVFDGIIIVTAGRALGWPLAKLGDGTWTLGGSKVRNYHP